MGENSGSDSISALKDKLGSMMPRSSSDIAAGLKKGFGQATSTFKIGLEQASSGLTNGLGQASNTLKNGAGQASNTLKNGAGQASNTLKNGAGLAGDCLKKGFEQATSAFRELQSKAAKLKVTDRGSVYSNGTRELSAYGFEKYNISDEAEIYVSTASSLFFNDGDPVFHRANDGVILGDLESTFEQAREEAQVKAAISINDCFKGIECGTLSDEIEVSCDVPAAEQDLVIEVEEIAVSMAEANIGQVPVQAEEPIEAEPVVEEVPETLVVTAALPAPKIEGLYVESDQPSDAAVETEVEFVQPELEAAETSAEAVSDVLSPEAVIPEAQQTLPEIEFESRSPMTHVEIEGITDSGSAVEEVVETVVVAGICDEFIEAMQEAETVEVPEPIPAVEIEDEVADIMKLTVPELSVEETGVDFEYEDIPSDGMEALVFMSPIEKARELINRKVVFSFGRGTQSKRSMVGFSF